MMLQQVKMFIKKIYNVFLILGVILSSSQIYATPSKVIIGYWSYPNGECGGCDEKPTIPPSLAYPIPGSLNSNGKLLTNQDMLDKLNYLNILSYAFLNVDDNGFPHFSDSYVDLSINDKSFCDLHKNICVDTQGELNPKLGNFDAFAKLQNKTNTLKKIVSIGGTDRTFNAALAHIPTFVDSVAAIVENFHLDGVDLDFEPDTFSPQQASAYGELVTALREKLGSNKLIIVTIAPNQNINRENWQPLANNSSFITDMCYDFHVPSYQPYITGYNSNLYSDPNEPMRNLYNPISCDQSIKTLAYLNVPPDKIVLGYPSYAIVYGGVRNGNNGLFQPFNPDNLPTLDEKKTRGSLEYLSVLKLLRSGFQEYATYYNGHISAVWAFNPITHQLITYDNPQLVIEKARYVAKNHLAGLMTWLINYDAPATSNESLLKAANQ